MSAPHCPSPDRKGVDVATYTVHPAAVSPDSEDLADALDREHRAHEATRQALVDATLGLERFRLLTLAARAVLSVCDSVTEVGQTEERLHQLGSALHDLRLVLEGGLSPLVVGVDLASGSDATRVVRAPPEAFTRAHALEEEMPGLPDGSSSEGGARHG